MTDIFVEIKKVLSPIIEDACRKVIREEKTDRTRVYPQTLTVSHVCEITSYSKNTIYQMHSAGKIPGAKKIGSRLVFDRDTILEWVDNIAR